VIKSTQEAVKVGATHQAQAIAVTQVIVKAHQFITFK
jgi:hypothetical protein